MKKKILVVTPTYLPILGGAEIGIYEVYKRLRKTYDVRILTPFQPDHVISNQGVLDEKLEEKNFDVVRFHDWLNLTKIKGQRFIGKLLPPISLSYISAIYKQVKDFRPHLINAHYIVPGGFAVLLARKFGKIPLVISLVGRTDVLGEENVYFNNHPNYFYKILDAASYILPVSNYTIGKYSGKTPVEVVPYGVDTGRFSPGEEDSGIFKKFGTEKNKTVLFTLQRLVKVKRVDLIIKSLKHVLESGADVLLIVGGNGPEKDNLKGLVKKLDLTKNVVFTGYISEKDIPKYFALSDIFVFASVDETFGIVLAQAMAAALPVVAIKSTAVPEVVVDRETGILVNSIDPKDFSKAVLRLINDSKLREKLSENSRKKAVENYDWNITTDKYDKVFKKVLGES